MRQRSRKGIKLASFGMNCVRQRSFNCADRLRLDGDGAQCSTQLEVMVTLMHRLRSDKHPDESEKVMLPCQHFEMIGGSGTGG